MLTFLKTTIALSSLSFFMITGCVQPVSVETGQSNKNPIIISLSANPNPVRVGNITIITVEATDPQNATLTYQWYASVGDITGQGKQVQYFATYCCAGSVKITVTVRNNIGGAAQQSFFINVIQ